MQRVMLLFVPALVLMGACDTEDHRDDDLSPVAPAEDEAPESLSVHEAQQPGKGKRMLAKFDSDGDGAISLAEAEGHLAQRFAKLDANGDGQLAADELAAMRGKPGKHRKHGGKHRKHGNKSPDERASRMLERLDTDQDGAISQTEAAAHHRLADKFAKIDADGDGKLTRAEIVAFKREHGREGERGGDGEPPVAG